MRKYHGIASVVKYRPRKSQNFDFLTVFSLKFFDFIENLPSISAILGSIQRTNCGNFFVMPLYAQFVYSKSFDPWKNQRFCFLTVF